MRAVYLLSLGCPRNLLDSEVLLSLLKEKGYSIAETAEEADIAIVNTCGFIQDAKQESIDCILQLAELKKSGAISRLIITGCLSQRYPDDLMNDISEIDAVFGTADFTGIPDALRSILGGEKIKRVSPDPDFLYDHNCGRVVVTPPHFAYVKIQEGCSNRCSYCVIPELKGPRRSRTVSSVIREVENLKKNRDLKEIVLIGQDTTSFGIDRGKRGDLVRLLKELSPVMEGGWIRLLYTHPANFTEELIEAIAVTGNICKYVDLPIQHINDRILRDMNRLVDRKGIERLIEKIRGGIRGAAIRTSVIVGFPGETGDDFRELLEFLEKTRFERLGAFVYSREEGTPAAGFGRQVPEDIKVKRLDEVMTLQQRISYDKNLSFIGSEMEAIIDEADPVDPKTFTGRTQMDAPEVDGVIYVRGEGLEPGDLARVRVTGTMEYDLIGEAV